ncbi:mitochondrial ribosomal protein L17 [Laetiporus sulphureus 93-53]|uniref:Mitochondrial ribosomal protein L17 n=1 Tax=Laetiporus sulphureus 93-53 TaxID=1314785 RepID=A0A165DZH2_9APHY|nr:mitochondrial ribosomal protein L17 [Laetiporus sulphureus 93-53]KZT05956.1 mitochondrial ribosomal protein L17 [Laetiporus sulphureus 93-53]
MKHGVAFRGLSRTSSHRMLMLRNLVTSLFEHEQIKTTLPKAKEAARLAEKMITLGKKSDLPAYRRANAFLLKPTVLFRLFDVFAKRYAERPGGYTRIHKFGHRQGDNAPHAILELVDNPRDLRFGMTARAVAFELLGKRVQHGGPQDVARSGIPNVEEVIERERELGPDARGDLRPKTRWYLQKVLRFRSEDAINDMAAIAQDHADTLLAQPLAEQISKEKAEKKEEKGRDGPSYPRVDGLRLKAGQTVPGGWGSTLRRSQGALAKVPLGRPRWFESRKLGVDRTDVWTRPS